MKHKFILAVMTVLLTMGLSSAAAYADTVTFTLSNPTQHLNGNSGGTLTYDVTATASVSNGAAVNLNGDVFNVGGSLILDDSDFFADAPFFLNPGEIETFHLFSITVAPGTTPGNYSGFFTILGGADGGAGDTLGTVNFATTVTPEPSSFVLLGSGLAGLVGVVRRRRLM